MSGDHSRGRESLLCVETQIVLSEESKKHHFLSIPPIRFFFPTSNFHNQMRRGVTLEMPPYVCIFIKVFLFLLLPELISQEPESLDEHPGYDPVPWVLFLRRVAAHGLAFRGSETSVPDAWSEMSVANVTLLPQCGGCYGDRAGQEGPSRIRHYHLRS